jgi:hypothetical protein
MPMTMAVARRKRENMLMVVIALRLEGLSVSEMRTQQGCKRCGLDSQI